MSWCRRLRDWLFPIICIDKYRRHHLHWKTVKKAVPAKDSCMQPEMEWVDIGTCCRCGYKEFCNRDSYYYDER
jgi:hypothetical protein